MDRTLADLAASGASPEVRLRIARGLVRAVAALHRRGAVHGALYPAAVLVAEGGDAVALLPSGRPDPAELGGWAAPEVMRGARPTRRADAFAAAALVQLALCGRGPFDARGAEPLEGGRRALFEAPRAACLDAPGLPAEVGEAIARVLEKSAWRRGKLEQLAAALDDAQTPEPGSGPSPSPSRRPRPSAASAPGWTRAATAVRSVHLGVRALARRIPPSPLHRAALVAAPLLAGVLLLLRPPGASLAREVGRALARGDLAAARAALDAAPRGADRALVEKLRGDLACARRAPDECLRRYRTALAARPELRTDEGLRRNVRALLSRSERCGTQRSAALLAGQLRDPDALPALQAARRSAGIFAFLCTGDAFDRAIAATRASAR